MKIRLWTLGSLEHGIIPSKESIDNLRNLLATALTDDVVDIVWGPDLKCHIIDTTEIINAEAINFSNINDEDWLSKVKENIENIVKDEVAKSLAKYFRGE